MRTLLRTLSGTLSLTLSLAALLTMSGCVSTLNVPPQGRDFHLSGCAPLLNCVSSESSVFLYHTDPIRLREPLTEASWQQIKTTALNLSGASENRDRFGYLDATCYSRVFHFPDFLELLVEPDNQTMEVRSQSLLGLFDFGVNRHRVSTLRQQLQMQGLALK